LEFLDDLDRHFLAGQHPFDRVVLTRPDPQIDLVRTQTDKARDLLLRIGLGRRAGRRNDHNRHHRDQARKRSGHLTVPLANGVPPPSADIVAMRSKRPFVIVTRKLPDPIETRMMELFSCRLNLDDIPLSKAELTAAIGQAEVLVPTVTDRIDAEVLA